MDENESLLFSVVNTNCRIQSNFPFIKMYLLNKMLSLLTISWFCSLSIISLLFQNFVIHLFDNLEIP